MSRSQAKKLFVLPARDMIAKLALPEPQKQSLQLDLEDAVRRGFLVDLEQLELTLARCGRM